MKVLTIGGAMRDVIIKYGKLKTTELTSTRGQQEYFVMLREGAKIEIDGIEYTTGGGATNAAVSFKRLGFDAFACCKVGNDLEGHAVLQQLQQDGIITDLIIKSTGHQTGTSLIIPSPSGDRTVLVYRGANITLQEDELPTIIQYDQLYISSLGGPTAQLLLPITKQAKKITSRLPLIQALAN
jgi:sugar/nucleoside kinase (ribokinase family)